MKILSLTVWIAIATACCAATALARWRRSPIEGGVPSVASPRLDAWAPPGANDLDEQLAAAAEVIAAKDPFRFANAPAIAPSDGSSGRAPLNPQISRASPRPTLVLKGIVGGPPWQAVIDGLPGQNASSVAVEGARFGDLVVRRVGRDSVVIQGADTSWVLGFKKSS